MNKSFKLFLFLLCSSPSSRPLRSFMSLCLLSDFAVSMALKPISAVCLSSVSGDCSFRRRDFVGSVSFEACSAIKNGLFFSSSRLSLSKRKNDGFVVFASNGATNMALTGVVFQPFEEVKKSSLELPIQPHFSLARQSYTDDCEAAINKQINVEYSVSYAYHAMFAYFDRDNIALKGLAKFFKESSEEEREHAEKLIKYQNIRGGRVALFPIQSPPSEFEHAEKGDALYAMELALSLEKLTNEKLLQLQKVANAKNDPQMADFIESEFLTEQVEAIKKISEYIVQLRMVGKGHGVWHFDQMLLHHSSAA